MPFDRNTVKSLSKNLGFVFHNKYARVVGTGATIFTVTNTTFALLEELGYNNIGYAKTILENIHDSIGGTNAECIFVIEMMTVIGSLGLSGVEYFLSEWLIKHSPWHDPFTELHEVVVDESSYNNAERGYQVEVESEQDKDEKNRISSPENSEREFDYSSESEIRRLLE